MVVPTLVLSNGNGFGDGTTLSSMLICRCLQMDTDEELLLEFILVDEKVCICVVAISSNLVPRI